MRAMKDSRVEWIGEIPQDWSLRRIKTNFDVVAGATPKSGESSFWDGDIPWITPADYSTEGVYVSTGHKSITQEGLDSCATSIIPEGSIIFSKRAPVGLVSISRNPLCTNQGCLSCIPKDGVDAKYHFYAISVFSEQFDLLATGTTFKEISADSFANFKLPYPHYETQRVIAAYLDTECAEIDALIAAKEKTNALLKERRQSIIYEAVTKGLDSTAPMKDSGVEWLGKIPIQWSVLRLRFIGLFQNGISKAGEFFGSGNPFVSYSDVYKNEVLPTVPSGLIESTEAERKLYSVEKGDVFFTRTSETKDEIGMVAVCKETIPGATFAGFLIRMRPTTDIVSTDFLRYYFSCGLQREYFAKEMTLVTRASLGQDLLKNMVVTIPSTAEQGEIVGYLDEQTRSIDAIIERNLSSIQRLKEYRQSLIYEAVTGKVEIE